MIIGTPRHKAKFEHDYDSIIIGSGIGGLSVASILAQAGQRVLVLERHYTAGGYTHSFARKGYEWDVGVHYIGEVHNPKSSMRRMFDYVSQQGIAWTPMDQVYDRIIIGDKSYDLVATRAAFEQQMIKYFPDEAEAIKAYLDLTGKVTRSAVSFFATRTLPPLLNAALGRFLRAGFQEYAQKTTDEVLRTLTSNEQLIAALTGQWGDYGLPPKRSSFAMHALLIRHYLGGGSFPVGGASSIGRAIVEVIERCHGQVVTNAEVKQVLLQGDRATGVELQDGTKIHGKNIISGVGVFNTTQKLLPEGCKQRQEYAVKLRELKPTIGHIGLYIGTNVDLKDLGLASANLWIYPDANHDVNVLSYEQDANLNFPAVYISFPSLKDPTWHARCKGQGAIEIVVPAPYRWFSRWENSRWQKRGTEYEALKQTFTEALLKVLLKQLPQLAGKIAYSELSTPLSTKHFTNHPEGAIYGIDHDPKRYAQDWLGTDTTIKNLYLTGQDTVSCGIGGALNAGILTALRLLGPWRGRHLFALL